MDGWDVNGRTVTLAGQIIIYFIKWQTLIIRQLSLWFSGLSTGVGKLGGFSSLIAVVLTPVPPAANHAREPQGLHILPGARARDEPIAPALPCSAEVANVHRANTNLILTKLKQHGIGSQHAATSCFLLQRAFSQVSALLPLCPSSHPHLSVYSL